MAAPKHREPAQPVVKRAPVEGARAGGLPVLEVAGRKQLRRWLEKNHATSPGVMLAVGKKGTGATRLTYEQAIEEALSFGWIDSTAQRFDDSRFLIRFTPRRPGGTWARSNKERVARLIEAGAMAPAGLAAVEAAKADGSWNRLDDIEALVIPDDLADEFAAAPHAAENFAQLPASSQRLALHWIGSARRPETRARRIAETVDAAAEGRRPVT